MEKTTGLKGTLRGLMGKRSVLFYASFLLYLAATTLQATMFNDYALPAKVFILCRYASFAGALAKIAMDLLTQLFGEGMDHGDGFGCAIKYLLVFAIAFVISKVCDERTPLFMVAFLIASNGVSLKKLFSTALVIHLLIMAVTVVSSQLELIPDLLFERDGNYIRHSLGYIYPSVFISYVFFTLVLFFWVGRNKLSIKQALILLVIDDLLFVITDSRMGFIVIALLVIVNCVGVRRNTGGSIKAAFRYEKVLDYTPLILSAITVFFCCILNTPAGQQINRLLTYRISYITEAVAKYGIHPLGANIEWIGYGGNTDTASFVGIYNFVDNSYASVVLNYGIVGIAASLIYLCYTSRKIRRMGSKRMYNSWIIVLLFCFIEPRLYEIHANLFLFCGADMLYGCPKICGWIKSGKSSNAKEI